MVIYYLVEKAYMKKLSPLLILLMVFVSCNNSNNDEKTPTYREVNVKNVNGNIPDTTNAIDLSTKKTDSTMRDSSMKH